MPILNLNGVERKHGIANGRTIAGSIFRGQLAAVQNKSTTQVMGTSYNSPFTKSHKSVFPTGQTVSTQPRVAALKHEQPGSVVPVNDFVKIHPWEKGVTWSTQKPKHYIVNRAGGPEKSNDVPSNPNARAIDKQKRPALKPVKGKNETITALSFVRSGGTLGGHADPQAGTSSDTSRWHTTKKGAVI